MTFLHYEFDLSPNDVVEVTLDKQANVRLLDSLNFSLSFGYLKSLRPNWKRWNEGHLSPYS
jgi:hypothetical protein